MEINPLVEFNEHLSKEIYKQQQQNCIVPYIGDVNNQQTQTQKNATKFNKCVPDDLILALKQAEQQREYIGPSRKKDTALKLRPVVPSIIRKPDNAWHFETQRDKFKFLTEQPICSCGAGRDISFLYDCSIHKDQASQAQQAAAASKAQQKVDLSLARQGTMANRTLQLENSLIPDEYKIVKSQGVVPINIEKSQYTTLTDDHTFHLTSFPSLKPTGRHEVLQLGHTMDAMLKRIGADELNLKGPTQLHNLLEIIKKEQDIYNIIFHEIIRQVTVECKERGEILAKLRERYANLFARVPREIKSLHEEIIAQRTLDKKLTDELLQFKATIEHLTGELAQTKEHDKMIEEKANLYQKDLHEAVKEAQNNALMLQDYHELYNLQRARLEKAVETLTKEREEWIRVSYCIAYKVTYENDLNKTKNLNVVEKAWSQTANELALSIWNNDIAELGKMQTNINEWKATIDEIRYSVEQKEASGIKVLKSAQHEIEKLRNILVAELGDQQQEGGGGGGGGKMIKSSESKIVWVLHYQIKCLHELINAEADSFSGELILVNDERIKKGETLLFKVSKRFEQLKARHPHIVENDKHREQALAYDKLQKSIKQLHQQYRNRISGSDGLSRLLIDLNNNLDMWRRKLYQYKDKDESELKRAVAVSTAGSGSRSGENEWQSLLEQTEVWLERCVEAIKKLNANSKPLDNKSNSSSGGDAWHAVEHDKIVNEFTRWTTTFSHLIESLNAFHIDQANTYHLEMVNWMINALIYLSPDKDLSDEAMEIIYNSVETVLELDFRAKQIGDKIDAYSDALVAKYAMFATQHEKAESDRERERNEQFVAASRDWFRLAKEIVLEIKNAEKAYDKDDSDSDNNDDDDDDEEEEDEAGGETNGAGRKTKLRPQKQHHISASARKLPAVEVAKVELDKNKPQYQVISSESNTTRKLIESIDFKMPADSAVSMLSYDDNKTIDNSREENEVKVGMSKAYQLIDELQRKIVVTEERAQKSEAEVAELELKLNQALEQIRALQRGNEELAKTPQADSKNETPSSGGAGGETSNNATPSEAKHDTPREKKNETPNGETLANETQGETKNEPIVETKSEPEAK